VNGETALSLLAAHTIGDATAARSAVMALYEGRRRGMEI
jgi:hypothetical protein